MRSGLWSSSRSKRVGAEPLQAALGRHPQVVGVLVRAAQARVGEAREAARPVALALVEVVADGADQAVVLARHARQRPAEQRGRPRPARRCRRVRTVSMPPPGRSSASSRSSSIVSPKCRKRPPLQVPIALRPGSRHGDALAQDVGVVGGLLVAVVAARRLGRSLAVALLGADADLLRLGLRRLRLRRLLRRDDRQASAACPPRRRTASRSTITVEPGTISPWRRTSSASGSSM